MRTALLWAITQRVMVIPYRRFGTTYRSRPRNSRILEAPRIGPRGRPETSVRNYRYSLRTSAKERSCRETVWMLLDGRASLIESFWKTDSICRLVDADDGVMLSEGIYWCRQTLTFGKGIRLCLYTKLKLNSVALVRERTIPTERPPPVGEVSANFCG
jgi:hypothetical protein